MSQYGVQCAVCAWRADCKKKFYIESEGGRTRCPDFTRDLTLPKEKEKEKNEGQG